jgi:hypothetical protein
VSGVSGWKGACRRFKQEGFGGCENSLLVLIFLGAGGLFLLCVQVGRRRPPLCCPSLGKSEITER